MTWRVDYAAEKHGEWLSLEDETFAHPLQAVKMAQRRMHVWAPCIGFRVVPATVPPFQKMEDRHLGKIVSEAGRLLIP